MIVLVTDFGLEGPYVGQMKAVLYREAPGIPVVDLFSDLAPFDPRGAAYLLGAYALAFPSGSVFLGVVDPGVGSRRRAVVVEADGRWYVGPDNGLFALVARRAAAARWWHITWQPERLSESFHGRDLFAPVAARVARGESVPGEAADPAAAVGSDWPEELARVAYVDRFGNAITGVRAAGVQAGARIRAGGRLLSRARTFSEAAPGEGFWYENSNGLVELAVNQGRADRDLGVALGAPVEVVAPA